jgi:hypothetical protein
MAKDVLLVTIGFLPSLIASGIFWWYLTKRVTPKIGFSDHLEITSRVGIEVYKVQLLNGARRGLLEPQIRATFRTRLPSGSVLSVWNIPVSNTNILRLRAGGNRILYLNFHELSAFALDALPPELAQRLKSRSSGSLGDLFKAGTDSRLQLEVVATDEWSGSRQYMASKDYRGAMLVWSEQDSVANEH